MPVRRSLAYIMYKFGPRQRDVLCTTVRDVCDDSQNAATHIRQLSGGPIFYWNPVSSAGVVLFPRRGVVLYCTSARSSAQLHKMSKWEDRAQGLWRFVKFLVGIATRLTTGTTPVKISESHNRTATGIGYRESIVPTRSERNLEPMRDNGL